MPEKSSMIWTFWGEKVPNHDNLISAKGSYCEPSCKHSENKGPPHGPSGEKRFKMTWQNDNRKRSMICAFSQTSGEKRSQHMDLQGRKGPPNSRMIAEKGPVWVPSCKKRSSMGRASCKQRKKVWQDMEPLMRKGPQKSKKIARKGPGWVPSLCSAKKVHGMD